MADIEKVKQALRNCDCRKTNCDECSYRYGGLCADNITDCTGDLASDALSVIESLQSENKILTENNIGIDEQRGEIAMRLEKLRLQNERLKENIDTLLPVLHGEWEEKEYSIGKCHAICSLCKKSSMGYAKDTGFGFEYSFPNYCPHCGAKMKDGEVNG